MSSSGANKDKLTLAAEELIKAASSHVETSSIALSQETVQELKMILKASSSLESKLDTVNQKLSLLEKNAYETSSQTMLHLDTMNKSITLQTKYQKIEWAFDHAAYGSFDCINRSNNNYVKSSEIIKEILLSFRQGYGYDVTKYASDVGYNSGKDGKAEFRVAIVEQLYELIGKKPRLVVHDEKKCVIYYE